MNQLIYKEFCDFIQKHWLIAPNVSKEARDKQSFDIFQYLLTKINSYLYENNSEALFNLLTEKLIYLKEYTGITEWNQGETLKVQNLHRLALFIYNYQRLKMTSKSTKEVYYRGFENIAKFLDVYMEMINNVDLKENFLFNIFDDFFYFYKKAKESAEDNEYIEKITEDMEGTLSLVFEETSKIITYNKSINII